MVDPTAPCADARLPTQLVLQPEPSAVREGRQFVRAACEDLGLSEETCDTAVLLGSELITNAFMHGRSEARISINRRADVLRVAVADDNSRHPEMVAEDLDALDGRGLTILELLAHDWGVVDDAYGKTVWFTLPL